MKGVLFTFFLSYKLSWNLEFKCVVCQLGKIEPIVNCEFINTYCIIPACPTCNDFHGLVQRIMELQDILAKTSAKVMFARTIALGEMKTVSFYFLYF